MLLELEVRDLAIIDHVRCPLTAGFNVLTGETGAGKSILVDALGLLVGERADYDLIRAGSERAWVQGVFEPGIAVQRVAAVLSAYGIDAEERLILSRELVDTGRSTARVNGRVVPVRALDELGRCLVDVYGEGQAASLKRPAEHVELLDRYAGVGAERLALAERVERLRAARGELAALRREEAALTRRAELLAFQVEEITMARLSPEEEAELLRERARLANAERLVGLAEEAYVALRDPAAEGASAEDLLDRAAAALEALARIDATMEDVRAAVAAAAEVTRDRASQVLAYRDQLDFDPLRLQEVEERLAVIGDLKRKYGPDVPAVQAAAARASEELARITHAEERLGELTTEVAALRDEVGRLAGQLSARRGASGERLARAVEAEMAALGMPGSHFAVAIRQRPDPDGVPVDGECLACDATGVDEVAFLVSANPGEPPRPLVAVASGGETARIMLALKTILSAVDEVPCLVFDEIDAGIGGRVGAVVGRRLAGLADRHQVLCVTHLPQVAVFGDSHWQVSKGVIDGRTVTEVRRVDAADRVNEVAQMLGSGSDAGRQNALQLLQQSEQWKAARRPGRPATAGT